jgi:hypothetical protein
MYYLFQSIIKTKKLCFYVFKIEDKVCQFEHPEASGENPQSISTSLNVTKHQRKPVSSVKSVGKKICGQLF